MTLPKMIQTRCRVAGMGLASCIVLSACLLLLWAGQAYAQAKVRDDEHGGGAADATRRHGLRTAPVRLNGAAIEVIDPASLRAPPNNSGSMTQVVVPPGSKSVDGAAAAVSSTEAGDAGFAMGATNRDMEVEGPRALPGRGATPRSQRDARRRGRQAATQPVIAVGPLPPIEVTLNVGESRLIRGLKSSRVVVGSDKIVTAAVLDDRLVMLFGNAPGATTMQVWDTLDQMRTFRVTVGSASDVTRIAQEVRDYLSDVPGVRVRVMGDKVFVDGNDLSDESLHRIQVLAKQFDRIVNMTENQKGSGGWDRMVMLDVKVVEFRNRERVRDLGVLWATEADGPRFGIGGDIKSSTLRDGEQFYVSPTGVVTSVAAAATYAPFRSFFGWASVLASRLRLMATDGDAVILAEPQLAARNGRSASMNVGGRIPIVVPGGLAGPGSVTHERYGVKVTMTPTIGRDGMIQSKVMAEVSELDQTVSVNGMPGFKERMVETVFNVVDGQTMVLSGLIQRRRESSVEKVPLLGDIPILKHAFSRTNDRESELEIVIFVTAKIVDAAHPGVVQTIDEAQRNLDRALGDRVGRSNSNLIANPKPALETPASTSAP
jgi:pilus assembly protein CpaC